MVHNGDSYALLEQLPNLSDTAKKTNNTYAISAVKLGDNISRGTVPKYELQVMTNNNNKWKIQSTSIRMKNETAHEIVQLYARHESKQKNATLQKKLARHPHPILQAARDQHKQAISTHISALAEKFISKEKDIHLNAHWNNESETKDTAKIAEEKMYQGWSL